MQQAYLHHVHMQMMHMHMQAHAYARARLVPSSRHGQKSAEAAAVVRKGSKRKGAEGGRQPGAGLGRWKQRAHRSRWEGGWWQRAHSRHAARRRPRVFRHGVVCARNGRRGPGYRGVGVI